MQTNQATIVIRNVLDAMDNVNAAVEELGETRKRVWKMSATIALVKKEEAKVQLQLDEGEAVVFLKYAPDFLQKTIAQRAECIGEVCDAMMKAKKAEAAMFAAAALVRGGEASAPLAGPQLAFAGLRQTLEAPAYGSVTGSSFFEAVLEEAPSAPKEVIVVEDDAPKAPKDDEAVVIVVEDDRPMKRVRFFAISMAGGE